MDTGIMLLSLSLLLAGDLANDVPASIDAVHACLRGGDGLGVAQQGLGQLHYILCISGR